jgi:hypothetical protein
VWRDEDVLEVFFAFAAGQGGGDVGDVEVVDEDAPRLAGEGDMDAADLVLPAGVAVLVNGDAVGDDETLDPHVILSAAKDPLGHSDHACRGSLACARDDTALGNRLREKHPIFLPRLPRLLDVHKRPVLPPHHPSPLAVDHASSRVTSSGA